MGCDFHNIFFFLLLLEPLQEGAVKHESQQDPS